MHHVIVQILLVVLYFYIIMWLAMTVSVCTRLIKTKNNERFFWLQILCVPFILFFTAPVLMIDAVRGK